jgi:dihydrofolate reductase
MRKLVESTHVSLGGEIGSPQDWAFPYLDEEHAAYATELLNASDALLLGRRTYQGLSAAYMGAGQHLFEEVPGAPPLSLTDVKRFRSGVLLLTYAPMSSSARGT